MKKFGIGLMSAGLLCLLGTGCNNLADDGSDSTSNVQYGEIGASHNAMLAEYYQLGSTNRSVETGQSESDFTNYFGESEVILSYDLNEASSDGATENVSLVSGLVEQSTIQGDAAVYMKQIEDILLTSEDDVPTVQEAILKIRQTAEANLSGQSWVEFDSYSDTALASVEFWDENYSLLSSGDESETARGILSWLKKHQRKLKAAASDAAGAASGAGIGIKVLTPFGVPVPVAAAIGATVVGAASSVEGYNKNKICVVKPVQKLLDEARKRGYLR